MVDTNSVKTHAEEFIVSRTLSELKMKKSLVPCRCNIIRLIACSATDKSTLSLMRTVMLFNEVCPTIRLVTVV